MEAFSPRRHPSGDIAAHHDAVEPGPTPLVRALVGLALGAAAGTLIALATPPAGGSSMSRDPSSPGGSSMSRDPSSPWFDAD